jgi:hypothetical protein
MMLHKRRACFETRYALLSMRNVDGTKKNPQPEEQRAALRLEGRTVEIQ